MSNCIQAGSSQQTDDLDPLLVWVWASSTDAGPTLRPHLVNDFYVLSDCTYTSYGQFTAITDCELAIYTQRVSLFRWTCSECFMLFNCSFLCLDASCPSLAMTDGCTWTYSECFMLFNCSFLCLDASCPSLAMTDGCTWTYSERLMLFNCSFVV